MEFPFGRCIWRERETLTKVAGSWFVAPCFEHARPSIISTTSKETAESISDRFIDSDPHFYGKKDRIGLRGFGETWPLFFLLGKLTFMGI